MFLLSGVSLMFISFMPFFPKWVGGVLFVVGGLVFLFNQPKYEVLKSKYLTGGSSMYDMFLPFLFMSLLVLLGCFFFGLDSVSSLVLFMLFLGLYSVDSTMGFFLLFESMMVYSGFLILFFGYKPERLKAFSYFLVYSLLGGVPFFFFVVSKKKDVFKWESTLFLSLLVCVLLPMLMKVPVYGFHLWLPKAHVEAPVYGSMLLAGIMMKLGLYGLVFFLVNLNGNYDFFMKIVMFGFVGGVMVSGMACLRQFDMKAYIAFSSMVHMAIAVFFLFNLGKSPRLGLMIVSLGHAFVSCGLFCSVTIIYKTLGTRKLQMKKTPSGFGMVFFLFALANSSMPLSLSFLGEVMIFSKLIKVGIGGIIIWFVFVSGLLSIWLWCCCKKTTEFKMKLQVKKTMMMTFFLVMSYGGFFIFKSI